MDLFEQNEIKIKAGLAAIAENIVAERDAAYKQLMREYMALLGRCQRAECQVEELRKRMAEQGQALGDALDKLSEANEYITALKAMIEVDANLPVMPWTPTQAELDEYNRVMRGEK